MMTTKILLIKNIQTYEEWFNDCENIARAIVKQLNYPVPHPIFTDTLINNFKNFIFDSYGCCELNGEEPTFHPCSPNEILEKTPKDALLELKKQEINIDSYKSFEFTLSNDAYAELYKFVDYAIHNYIVANKSWLIELLNKIDEEIIIIYPSVKYYSFIHKLYKPDKRAFVCPGKHNKTCIRYFCKKTKTTDYEIVNLESSKTTTTSK